MKRLTKAAEELLKEILDHRLSNGECDTKYWKDRFEQLSLSEDILLRSLFKELRISEMISVSWADNFPYILVLLGNGVSYFEEIEREERMEKQSVSYVNNFYGKSNNVQIQQGNVHATQNINIQEKDDNSLEGELVGLIRKYDAVLNAEFGEDGNEVRNKASELDKAINEGKEETVKKNIVRFLRDLASNASGGLVAAGIIEIATRILG